MRLLAGKVLLGLLPFGFMAAVSYHVDPAHLFGSGSEAQIGALTAAGHAVVSPRIFDGERLVQRSYVRHLRHVPEVVVFGSSRAMQIHSAAFPGRRFANSAVFAASIEDLIAVAGMYDRAGRMPRDVVLVLDPWLLNGQSGLTGWKSISSEYGYMARRLGFPVRGLTRFLNPIIDRYLELLSPAYFQASVPSLFTPVLAEPVVAVEEVPGESEIILADGSRVPGRLSRERTPAEVAQLAGKDVAANLFVDNFTALDPLAREQFERLIRYLMSAGARVTLVLVPCHPVMFEALNNNPAHRAVALQEDYFRGFARQVGVPLLGSYDPVRAGCSDAEFFDGWHPRESCVNRVLASNRP